ncbi:hypothetical protein N9T12_00625 [bacterium]|nr:hypothetical protein [bacterium]
MDEENNAINELEENKIEALPVKLEVRKDEGILDPLENQKIEIIKDINADINIVSDQLPKINPTLIIADKQENQITDDIDFIGALEGFIVLILICMVAVGLSNLFKQD